MELLRLRSLNLALTSWNCCNFQRPADIAGDLCSASTERRN